MLKYTSLSQANIYNFKLKYMDYQLIYYVNFVNTEIGLKFLPNRSNKGVYVSGFYNGENNTVLEAENSGKIQPGDRVITIATTDVIKSDLDEVNELIKKSSRPLSIKFCKRSVAASSVITFQQVMKNENYRNSYLSFCERIDLKRCANKIRFYVEIQLFKDLNSDEQNTQANILIEKYLKKDAEFDVCMDSIFNSEDKKSENPVQDLLWIEGSLLKSLQTESFNLFCLSEDYQELRLSFDKVMSSEKYSSYILLNEIENGENANSVALYNELFVLLKRKDYKNSELYEKSKYLYKKFMKKKALFLSEAIKDNKNVSALKICLKTYII